MISHFCRSERSSPERGALTSSDDDGESKGSRSELAVIRARFEEVSREERSISRLLSEPMREH